MEREARILIIEDDPEWQEIIGGLCKEAARDINIKGTAISVASKPEEAQRLLQDSVRGGQSFDLVTIDINLRDPRGNTGQQQGSAEEYKEGLKFLEDLKTSSPETCALVVSAEVERSGQRGHIYEAFRKHASDFLEKQTLDRKEFKRRVKGALYYAEAIEHKNGKRFRSAEEKWIKAKELAPELNFPVNIGDILQAVMQNPITGLPSGKQINDQLRPLLPQKGWAVLKVRIAHLVDFYKHYGDTAGDDVLRFTAMVIKETVDELGTPGDFIGHTAANEFVIITTAGQAQVIKFLAWLYEKVRASIITRQAQAIITRRAQAIKEKIKDRFATEVGTFYNFKHREQGYIIVQDLDGQEKQVSLMSLEIGIVTADDGPFSDVTELDVKIAEALKESEVKA